MERSSLQYLGSGSLLEAEGSWKVAATSDWIVNSLVTCDKGSELKIRPVEWCHEAPSMVPSILPKMHHLWILLLEYHTWFPRVGFMGTRIPQPTPQSARYAQSRTGGWTASALDVGRGRPSANEPIKGVV